jgi:DNA-binding beta-propeller fold protein YncE
MAPNEEGSLAKDLLLDAEGASGSELLSEAERKRRRRKKQKLAAIGAVLAAIVAILIIRALSGTVPLPSIPSKLPHYVSSIYGVDEPMGVAVSPNGERVYVTESEGPRLVRVFNSSGEKIGALKPPGKKNSEWRLPVYVAVSPKTEDVYVSDRLREDVEVYGPEGKYLHAFKPKGRLGKGANPLGLAFGPEGDLYMTNVSGARKDHSVLVFGSSGEEPLRKLGTRDMFWFPNGITLDSHGDVYVADSDNGRLAILNPAGKLVSSIQRGVGEGDLNLPRGVAIDGEGRLFVADTSAQTVDVYHLPSQATEVPTYVGSFGVEGINNGQFEYPNGIAIDPSGRIYVTDRENGRVQVWSY